MRKCENTYNIAGFVGKDVQVSYTQKNKAYAMFSVATSESWKDKKTGEWNKHTEWHLVEAWGLLAERAAKWFRKGSFVRIIGKMSTKKWQDRETGADVEKKVLNARDLWILDKPGDGATDSGGETDFGQEGVESDGGDLPF